jgi:hypothetical protein
MTAFPRVLGCRTLRRTVKYASDPTPCGCPVARSSISRSLRFRLRKGFDETSRSVPQAGSQFHGLATAIHKTPGLARVHSEFPGGHELNLILNYSTRDKGIERQLLCIEKGL